MNKKSTSRWIVFVAWLLSMGAVFLLGALLGLSVKRGSIDVDPASAGDQLARLQAIVIVGNLNQQTPDMDGPRDAWVGEVRKALGALAQVSDTLQLRYEARVLARALDLTELLGTIQQMEGQPPSPARSRIMAALLERWGSLDPRSAMAYAASGKSGMDPEGALLSVLDGWALTAPRDAWKWVTESPATGSMLDQRVGAVILRAAQTDPQLAGTLARQAPTESTRAAALQAFLYQQLNRDRPQAVARWLEDVRAGDALEQATGYLAGEWARYAPAEAAAWAQQRTEAQGRSGAIVAVAHSWATLNPPFAAAWVAGLPAGEVRAMAAEAVAQGWLDQGGAPKLAVWLNSQDPHPDFDLAVAALARDSASQDPATALSWAATIQDAAVREMMALAIGRDWIATDPASARAAIHNSSLDSSLKRLLTGEPVPAQQTVTPQQPGRQYQAPQAVIVESDATPAQQEDATIVDSPPTAQPEVPVQEVIVEEVYEEDPTLDPNTEYNPGENTYYEYLDEPPQADQ